MPSTRASSPAEDTEVKSSSMAPSDPPGTPASDGDADREDFMKKLQAYHNERNTVLEPAPKVGTRIVDLCKLYKRVTEEGGYDAVSDIRNNKLMWRKIGQDFHLGSANSPTLAFTLKTVYYKNLAAYEIKHFHNRDPPPKEILEDVTAKGGDLLNRTVENFARPLSKEERFADSSAAESNAIEPQTTPPKQTRESEEPGSVSGRVTRGLRQAPPPRQLFQGEVAQPRTTRQASKEAGSPAPTMNPYAYSNGINGVPQSLAAYEPRSQLPTQLRPVMTPGNNYEKFKEEQKRIRDARAAYLRADTNRHKPTPGLVPPGTGFQGPTIYTRTLQSLQSGILEEQEYALYHLTKISHERGDRFRFDHFAGLAEALVAKVLEVGSLVLDVEWAVSFSGPTSEEIEQIREVHSGAPAVNFTRKRKRPDKLEPVDFSRRMTLVNEAALILRNMIMMDLNANYISRMPTTRALLVILLNLPQQASTTEIQQYGLDMAEQLTRYLAPDGVDDQLFTSLISFLDRSDRGVILAALRAICRFGLIPQQAPQLHAIPSRTIHRLASWMVLEDEELRSAALDLLYQYTIRPSNVRTLLSATNTPALVRQLVRLLLHGAKYAETKDTISATSAPSSDPGQATQSPTPKDPPIPLIPPSHISTLLSYSEPERSTQWLRSCFTEHPSGEITQIALWQAYQLPFAQHNATHPLLPAKDFITNVSTTFSKASAQVMQGENGTPRFVIRGIRARDVPVDAKGRGFVKCLWREEGADVVMTDADGNEASKEAEAREKDKGKECGAFARDARGLWEHIVSAHLGLSKNPDVNEGKYDFTPKTGTDYHCAWAGCGRFKHVQETGPYAVGMHVKTHLPDWSEKGYLRGKHNGRRSEEGTVVVSDGGGSGAVEGKQERTTITANTAVDEKAEAAGLPLTSVLVLRNIAKAIPKLEYAGADGTDVDVMESPEIGPKALKRGGADEEEASPRTRKRRRTGGHGEGDEDLMATCFGDVKERLFGVLALNATLREYVGALIGAVEDGGG